MSLRRAVLSTIISLTNPIFAISVAFAPSTQPLATNHAFATYFAASITTYATTTTTRVAPPTLRALAFPA